MVVIDIVPYKLEQVIPPIKEDGSQDAVIVQVIGRRGSGKSTLIYNLMHALKDVIDYWMLVTLTSTTERLWRTVAGNTAIHRTVDKGQLKQMLAFQDELAMKQGRRRKVAIIWDDVQAEQDALNGEAIRELFLNGRNLDSWFINADQYCMGMKPILRNQVDIVIHFYDDCPDNVEKFRTYYAGKLNKKQFYDTFLKCTNPLGDGNSRQAFVVDRVSRKFYTFKAKPIHKIPPFRIGNDRAKLLDALVGMSDEEVAAQNARTQRAPRGESTEAEIVLHGEEADE